MHRSRRHQVGSNVDTLALSRCPFKSFLQSLQQGCMLLDEPSYLSCLTPMNAAVCLQAPAVVIHPQSAPD
jgi:hypothetical protein